MALRDEAKCVVCGCSDGRACEGGCWWVFAGLCSRCVLNALAASGAGLAEPHRRQLAGELLPLADALDPEPPFAAGAIDAGAIDGGANGHAPPTVADVLGELAGLRKKLGGSRVGARAKGGRK